MSWDRPTDDRGQICTVAERALGVMTLLSYTQLPPPPPSLHTIWEVLREWKCTWLWENLQMVGDDHWIRDAIFSGSCIAVSDGSFIREMHPHLCSTAFIMECTHGRGRLIGSFKEASRVANAYRGELLGLMAIHLLLVAVQQTTPELSGVVTIYSDCLGALGRVRDLPPTKIPTRCRHSGILKKILISCTDLSFEREYEHVRAHQDDALSFSDLDRPAQLNCVADAAAKRQI